MVRDPAKYEGKFPSDPRLEVVAGDVTDRASLHAALRGARGVIFAASGTGYWTAKDVDYQVRLGALGGPFGGPWGGLGPPGSQLKDLGASGAYGVGDGLGVGGNPLWGGWGL